jgi:SAM-dependent methyltransferase
VWSARRHPSPALNALLAELLHGICGVGHLFHRYPATVDALTAVEPDPDLRTAAIAEAGRLRLPVRVVDVADGGDIPAATGSADAVVCCEVFCSVADTQRLLGEIRRVLRPGGELRVLEHVAANSALGRAAQLLIDELGWPRLLGGCHVSRETSAAISGAGFDWIGLRRVWYARTPMLAPLGPHIIGAAALRAGPRQR